MAKDRRPRPDRAKRAQTHGVKGIKRVKIGINRLGALHMQDACDHALGQAGANLCRAAADLEATVRGALHPQQLRCHIHRDG